MNGVHDMGGMHGFGPVEYEGDEPVFHEPWEGRVYALTRAMGAWGKWNIDASRHSRELIPPAEYLRMSYYEKRRAQGHTRAQPRTGRGVHGQENLQPGRAGARAFRNRAAGPRAQPSSHGPHSAAAVRARQAGDGRPGPRRLRFSGHQRALSGGEPAAPVLGALRGARAVGRGSVAARYGVHRHVGRLP